MIDPAKPFSSKPRRNAASLAAGAKADLTGLLDRARDERFRLLKMLKDARAEVAVTVEKQKPATPAANPQPQAVPLATAAVPEQQAAPTTAATTNHAASPPAPATEKLQALVTKLSALDAQIDAKLHRVNTITDEKIARLEQTDTRVSAIAQQLGHALADGRMLQQNLATTIDKTRDLPVTVTQQLERFDDHVAAYQTLGTETLGKEMQHMKQALFQEISAEMGQQRLTLDAELAKSHKAATRDITSKFDALAESLQQRSENILANTQNTAETAMKRVRKQVVESMARAHDTQEAFKFKLDEHQDTHRQYLDSLTDSADGEFQVQAQRLDETMTGLAELFDSQADQILTELRDRATALLDQMSATVLRLQQDAPGGNAAEKAASGTSDDATADDMDADRRAA